MHFSINRKYFYERLSIVSRAISLFSPLPALSGICIDVKNDCIVLTGSDSNISIRSTIVPGELNQLVIEKTGSIIIESKYLLEIIRKMDCMITDIELIDNYLVRISSDNGKFHLNGIEADEYPNVDFGQPALHFTMKSESLRKIVSQTAFACSDKDQRPVLTGVNFKSFDNILHCSATDSYRLATKQLYFEELPEFNVTIPAKSLTEVVRSVSEEEDIEMYVSSKKVQFVLGNTIIQSRLIDGNFPDVERIIPTSSVAQMTISSSELAGVIDRTNFIRNEKQHLVKMEFSEETCRIKTSSNEIGNSNEVLVDYDYQGEELSMSCNGTFMLDAVRALASEQVLLQFSGLMKPIRISDPKDDSALMIIVPIRSYD